jgi:hypothetical protein
VSVAIWSATSRIRVAKGVTMGASSLLEGMERNLYVSPMASIRPRAVLALDQGTTSSRALVVGADGRILGRAQAEFPQHFPRPGWVEHDPEDLWREMPRGRRSPRRG